ncbi:MAG: 4Fe-4S cluster-binding domain-containing protein [Bacteroidales bacterium]|nr:4Fe-4S cluster-binding domain-containing protein [Bacteroidales bacterium]
MKCIKEEDSWLKTKLIRQPKENLHYRLSKFVVKLSVDGGFLLYNTATGCILYFENEIDFQDSTDQLIQNWFFLPSKGFDEFAWVEFLRDKKRELSQSNPTKSYIIMTTMDCNARCFYCYEKGRKAIYMTEKSANDISNYIISNAMNNKVKISWFGGEPLINQKVIDVICNNLKKNNIKFISHIITNGLLFTKEATERAKNVWNLKKAQVTIDGTEEIYLRTKAFKNGHGDEFQNVMHNIDSLLENNIAVSIRLNQSFDNTNDLLELSDYIKNRFVGNNNLSVYNRLLFDEEITEDTQNAYFKLKHKLRALGLKASLRRCCLLFPMYG